MCNHVGAVTLFRKTRIAIGTAALLMGSGAFSGACAASSAAAPDDLVLAQYGRGYPDQGYPYGVLGGGWREQRAYGYMGPAGLYSCEQGHVRTYLARKACGGAKFPNRFF